MKFVTFACVLQFLFINGNAQFSGNFFGRPHPLYMQRDVASSNMITTLALLGFDINEILAMQAINNGEINPAVLAGLGLDSMNTPAALGRGPMTQLTQQHMRDVAALSLLGLIDGPDAPDAPAARGGNPQKAGGAAPAGGGTASNDSVTVSSMEMLGSVINQITLGPGVRRQGPRRRNRQRTAAGNTA